MSAGKSADDAVVDQLLAIMDRSRDPKTWRQPRERRVPASLSGSERPGGGDPLGDYLYLKGER